MRSDSNRGAARSDAACRVGIFGKVGAGNIGNDASMEAVLNYLRAEQPGAIVDAMCTGPARLTARYGIGAVPLFWHDKLVAHRSGPSATALKVIGKGIDAFRTASWVRRHDVVIVPGAGVLETSLPMVPRGFPLSLFVLSACGKAFGTKVAMVSVGAGKVRPSLTKWLLDSAARLAFYRSYRDEGALAAMRGRGLDTSQDHVYPDLAFAVPVPACAAPPDPQHVAVGVMAFYGTHDDRKRAEEIYLSYVREMQRFVAWLIDDGRKVHMIIGDANGSDDAVVREIITGLRASRPDLDPASVIAEPVTSFADLATALLPVGSVVAIRFHNVLGALMLAKPTISISYSPKHDVLMADMGVPEFCVPVGSLTASQLIERFTELERQSAQVHQAIMQHNADKARLVGEQFAELTSVLFPPARKYPALASGVGHE